MINVLMVATAPPQQALLVEALARFQALGAKVYLACFFDVEAHSVDRALAEQRGFQAKPEEIDDRLRRALQKSQQTRKIWLHARRSTWVGQRAKQADVLVALDPNAVHTVWELAQRNSRADAVYGLAPSLKAVDARRRGASPHAVTRLERQLKSTASLGVRGSRRLAIHTAKVTLRKATGVRMMRNPAGAWLWSRAVAAPRVPDRLRSKLTLRVYRSMLQAERPAVAARTSAAAVSRLQDPQTKADLLANEALAELGMGRVPAGLQAAISAQLARSDAHLKKDPRKAAQATSMAWHLASNRVLHFDRLSSPLAEDPDAFLAPFRQSTAAQRLSAPRGRAATYVPAPSGRPLRVLLATLANDNFLREIRQRYEAMPGVEVRFLDLNADPARRYLALSGGRAIMEHILGGNPSYGHKVEEWLRPHLDWADTVFVDWCVATAALFTLHDPGTTRIIVRLHSFEAFNFWPHLVDFSRVDDVVFVSEHLRDLSTAVRPQLVGEHRPRLSVISNAMDLRAYARPKSSPDARFTLGLVGISAVAKDPRWAVEVLRLLREHDSRYRLLLVGSDLDPKPSAAAKQYADLLRQDLAELEPSGAVRRLGQTDDVPGALADVGVILSSSVRESFHCALVEGAASGAVPVVRDWPFFAGKEHSARTLFPAEWVVDTPEEAAKRILTTTATEQIWREEGRAAAAHAVDSWDWTVTRRQFDELLLGAPVKTLD